MFEHCKVSYVSSLDFWKNNFIYPMTLSTDTSFIKIHLAV